MYDVISYLNAYNIYGTRWKQDITMGKKPPCENVSIFRMYSDYFTAHMCWFLCSYVFPCSFERMDQWNAGRKVSNPTESSAFLQIPIFTNAYNLHTKHRLNEVMENSGNMLLKNIPTLYITILSLTFNIRLLQISKLHCMRILNRKKVQQNIYTDNKK